eukprot:UN25035
MLGFPFKKVLFKKERLKSRSLFYSRVSLQNQVPLVKFSQNFF